MYVACSHSSKHIFSALGMFKSSPCQGSLDPKPTNRSNIQETLGLYAWAKNLCRNDIRERRGEREIEREASAQYVGGSGRVEIFTARLLPSIKWGLFVPTLHTPKGSYELVRGISVTSLGFDYIQQQADPCKLSFHNILCFGIFLYLSAFVLLTYFRYSMQ